MNKKDKMEVFKLKMAIASQREILEKIKKYKFESGHNQQQMIIRDIEINLIKSEYKLMLLENPVKL